MILTGTEISENVKNGSIVIDPYCQDNVNPNSYNFRLDRYLKVYRQFPLDPKINNEYDVIEIPDDGFVLQPGTLYLANTIEVLGSTKFVPTFNARSSIARLGIFINLSASLCDIGFIGQLTLQLYCVHPVRVYPCINVGQMMFWKPKGKIVLYTGKYQGSRGAQTTKIHKDFLRN